MGPVDLHDLVRHLATRQHVRWRARPLRALEAEVDEGQEDCVLVCGGVAALVEQLEDALGEGDRVARVGDHQSASYGTSSAYSPAIAADSASVAGASCPATQASKAER